MAFQFINRRPDTSRAEDFIYRAMREMEAGYFTRALEFLKRARQIAQDNIHLRLEYRILQKLAEVYMETRKYKAALQCHKQMVKIIKEERKGWIRVAPTQEEKRRRTSIAEEPAEITSRPTRARSTQSGSTRSRSSRTRTSRSSKLPKCKNCRSPLEPGDKYCIGCGMEIPPTK